MAQSDIDFPDDEMKIWKRYAQKKRSEQNQTLAIMKARIVGLKKEYPWLTEVYS